MRKQGDYMREHGEYMRIHGALKLQQYMRIRWEDEIVG